MAKVAQEDTLLRIEELLSLNSSLVSKLNSISTVLPIDGSWSGESEFNHYQDVMVACKTDQIGVLYMEFSVDGVNWDSSISYPVAAATSEIHILVKGSRYYRTRFSNTSGVAQSYFRLQTSYGTFRQLNSPLNGVVQSDADSLLVRPMDFNLMIAQGLYQNVNNTIKDGINFDIDSATVPEDITNEGGAYAGFPTGAVEAGQIVVSGADTGTVYYSYMASSDSTDYTIGTKAVAGAGTYALGHNIWRCNFAYFVGSSATALNAGDITIQNTPTVANIFCVIGAGYGQTFCSAYTVPSGSSIYIDRFQGNMRGSTSGSLDGVFWYRAFGESPRYRFPFELQYGSLYFDDVDYLIRIPEKTDFIPRILSSSANNLQAKFTYRFLKIKT